MEKLTLVKVGGKIVETPNRLRQLLEEFATLGTNKILVHGGGTSATALAETLGIKTEMVNGRRITDRNMLQVVTMVYGGLINKNIVTALQSLHINALGLTGADLNYMRSEKRGVTNGIDYGYVGDVTKVDGKALTELINKGIVPVLAPLTHDGKGNLLNTNADTIAAEAAKALSEHFEVKLVYCFEKNGVLTDENDEDSVIENINLEKYKILVENETIKKGMIPKMENAFDALRKGVHKVLITNAEQLTQPGKGTDVFL